MYVPFRHIRERFKCRLPWMSTPLDHAFPLCAEETADVTAKMEAMTYEGYRDEFAACYDTQRCEFNTYDLQIQDEGEVPGYAHEAEVVLMLGSPYIQVVEDQEAYDLQSLIGEVGGTLGLMLGLSFLSIVDLLDMVTARLMDRCENRRRRRHKKKKKADQIRPAK